MVKATAHAPKRKSNYHYTDQEKLYDAPNQCCFLESVHEKQWLMQLLMLPSDKAITTVQIVKKKKKKTIQSCFIASVHEKQWLMQLLMLPSGKAITTIQVTKNIRRSQPVLYLFMRSVTSVILLF